MLLQSLSKVDADVDDNDAGSSAVLLASQQTLVLGVGRREEEGGPRLIHHGIGLRKDMFSTSPPLERRRSSSYFSSTLVSFPGGFPPGPPQKSHNSQILLISTVRQSPKEYGFRRKKHGFVFHAQLAQSVTEGGRDAKKIISSSSCSRIPLMVGHAVLQIFNFKSSLSIFFNFKF